MSPATTPSPTPSDTNAEFRKGVEKAMISIYPEIRLTQAQKLLKLFCELEDQARWATHLSSLNNKLQGARYQKQLSFVQQAIQQSEKNMSTTMSLIDLIEQEFLYPDTPPSTRPISMDTEDLPPLLKKVLTVDERPVTPEISRQQTPPLPYATMPEEPLSPRP